ncbi:hypothetical protein GEMRC1_005261 [Eukaryota sp. GEM-RC1]
MVFRGLSQWCFYKWTKKVLKIDFFVQNFSFVIDENDLIAIENYPFLTPEILKNLKSILPPSYDLFLVKCLVKSWKNTKLWTVEDFEDVFLNYDFQSGGDGVQILNILSKLLTDSRLADRLTLNLLNHALGALNYHHKELKEIYHQNVALIDELSTLRHSFLPWVTKLEQKEKELLRDSIGTFNPSNCSPGFSLSDYNHVVRKVSPSGREGTFVEVIHSDNCTLKFTKLDDIYYGSFMVNEFIGWKERDILQDSSTPNPAICPKGVNFAGSFSPSEPRFPPITTGESITVTFADGYVHFKPSTCTTTFSIENPKNLVFGVYLYWHNKDWKVERI